MGELQAGHAADDRAVVVIVAVPAAHAVDDAHRFRHRLPITQHDFAAGGAGRVAHALELQAGEDVGQPAVAVLRDAAGVKSVKAGGQNDIAYLHCME